MTGLVRNVHLPMGHFGRGARFDEEFALHGCIYDASKSTAGSTSSKLTYTSWSSDKTKKTAAQLNRLNQPSGVAVDGEGNVLVADTFNHCIRKISPQGLVSTLAGTGERGKRDGEGSVARFSNPDSVAVHGNGDVIVADA